MIYSVTVYAYHGGERFVDTFDRIVSIRAAAIERGYSVSGIAAKVGGEWIVDSKYYPV